MLSIVRSRFQNFNQLLDLDQIARILLMLEQLTDGLARDLVGFILEAIDLDAVQQYVAIFLQKRYRLRKFLTLQEDDSSQLGCGGRGLGDLVHGDPGSGGVDQVENVVERRGKLMNVFAVKRRNECLIELGQYGMRQVITHVFDPADFLDLSRDLVVVGEQICQNTSSSDQIVRHFGEHCEKTDIFRNEWNPFRE